MRRELVAAGAKYGAAYLQLGFMTPACLEMGSKSDGPLDAEEESTITIATRSSSVKGAKAKAFGFCPDWNPAGFTYKRREKAATKKKISNLLTSFYNKHIFYTTAQTFSTCNHNYPRIIKMHGLITQW